MPKFFHKIRKTLMRENKFSGYLLYAIGEIALVVIGILIALQINTWNEGRKLIASEIHALRQLNIDLRTNADELAEMNRFMLRSNRAGRKILTHLENGLPYSDSLSTWIELYSGTNIFNNANTTYKNIENSDRVIISNDSLRIRITLMYEKDFANVHRREDMLRHEHLPLYKKELHRTFKPGPVQRKWMEDLEYVVNTPIDLVALRTDEQYANALLDLYNFRLLRMNWLKKTISDLDILILDIEKEIQALESK